MSTDTDLKHELLRISQELLDEGYFGTRYGTAGNVSALCDDQERVIVTPSSKNYRDITIDDLCVVNLEGQQLEGKHSPSIETPMHLAVYRNRRDVNAVIHTHQRYATMLSIINAPIPALFDEVTVAIGHTVDIVPYGLSGSEDLLNGVVDKLANRCHCYILQNHGALCVGPDLAKTRHFVELLEKCAMVYYHALASGREVTVLPEPMPMGLFQLTTGKQDMVIAQKDAAKAASGQPA